MSEPASSLQLPQRRWKQVRLKWLFQPSADANRPDEEVLSVYRDYGVIPKLSRSDNFNVTPQNLDRYLLVRPDDLVVNRMKAWQGSLGISQYRGIVSGDYEVLRPRNGDLEPGFAHHLLRSSVLVSEYRVRSTGIRPSQWRLYWEQMGNIVVSVPCVEEQRLITDFLHQETTQIDALIARQEQLIETLHERRTAAVAAALDSAPLATSGSRLKHLADSVVQGWSPQCYAWPADGVETWGVLKAGAANRGVFRPMENKQLPDDLAPRPDLVVRPGHLVVSRANTRELVGSAAVVENEYPRLMLCDKLYAFTLDESWGLPKYVALVLGTRRWRDLIELCAVGASPSMQNISQSDILNLPMDLPAISDQVRVLQEIEETSSKTDALIAKAEKFIELAKERRTALITAAVTGGIDVSTGKACEGA